MYRAKCNLGPLAAIFIGPNPGRWVWANELTLALASYPPARPAKPRAFSVNTSDVSIRGLWLGAEAFITLLSVLLFNICSPRKHRRCSCVSPKWQLGLWYSNEQKSNWGSQTTLATTTRRMVTDIPVISFHQGRHCEEKLLQIFWPVL